MPQEKKSLKVIDCTPTWSGVLPIYLDAIQHGDVKQYEAAKKELENMANVADAYVKLMKETK